MIAISCLDTGSLRPYILLVGPGLRKRLLSGEEEANLSVWGASFWGQPAGAVVAFRGEKSAQLLDIYVLPAYRQAGIGAALLAEVEEAFAQVGIHRMKTLYRADEHTPAFETLLRSRGWSSPRVSSQIFWTRCAVAFGPWVSRYHFRLPYELFAWNELTPTEHERLLAQGEMGWYPPDFSPFHRPDVAWDSLSSVGLRCNGEVVGWCLTVRETPDQMLVDILFVDPSLQRLGRGFMLVGEVIRRFCSSGGDYAYWRVNPDNEPMLRWSRKAFAREGLVDQYDEWYSEKSLLP